MYVWVAGQLCSWIFPLCYVVQKKRETTGPLKWLLLHGASKPCLLNISQAQ